MDRIENNRQFLLTTRKTEAIDTQDSIKHHDPDYHKHKKQNKRNDWDDHNHDEADISIESLIIFLEGLKKETDKPVSHSDKKIDQSMQKAISAYGHQKSPIKKRYTYLDDDEQHEIDRDLIDVLIHALQDFQNQGFDHMKLIPAKGFLQSIQKTVEKIQSL